MTLSLGPAKRGTQLSGTVDVINVGNSGGIPPWGNANGSTRISWSHSCFTQIPPGGVCKVSFSAYADTIANETLSLEILGFSGNAPFTITVNAQFT